MSIGIGIGISPIFGRPLGGGAAASWTPLLPTTSGGVSAHTIICPALGLSNIFYQDSAKTTPAVSDGDPIGAAVNRGTDTYDVVQATTSAKPTLKTGANGLNNQPVIRVDGDDYLQGAFSGGAIAQPFTICAIAKLDASAVNDNSYRTIFDGDDSANRAEILQNAGTTPDKWSTYSGGSSTLTGGNTDASWHIWMSLYNGLTSQFWSDGTSQATGPVGTNTPNGLTLAARYDGAATFWLGNIAAILIYSGNLSNADKNQIGQWAATLYGLSYSDIT